MTLVLNEIHLLNGFGNTVMVAAADRRVTHPDGKHSARKKLFPIQHLDGCVSYYGLADVYPGGKPQPLSSWLPNFIAKQCFTNSLGEFATNLRDALHLAIPRPTLKHNASGFHIMGYNEDGYPDWLSGFLASVEHRRAIGLHLHRSEGAVQEAYF